MSSLNSKCRTNFDEWLESIEENDLEFFVFANSTPKADFDSSDFKLVYCGISNADPADCHMIEARVNEKTKDKQLKRLLQTSASVARDPTRLAFVLIPKSMDRHCKGVHVKKALQKSPVEGKSIVNKMHLLWDPLINWEGNTPRYAAHMKPFVFEKIPFKGYDLDGIPIAKGKDKQ